MESDDIMGMIIFILIIFAIGHFAVQEREKDTFCVNKGMDEYKPLKGCIDYRGSIADADYSTVKCKGFRSSYCFEYD